MRRYAIPIEAIGSLARIADVQIAIEFHHSIVSAKYISCNVRVESDTISSSNNSNVIFPALSDRLDKDDTGIYLVATVDSYGSRRLVQDLIATRVLESSLFVTVACTILAWCLGDRKLLPSRSPTSVANTLALPAGGDVLDSIYRDGLGYCLGWGPLRNKGPTERQRFGLWNVGGKGE